MQGLFFIIALPLIIAHHHLLPKKASIGLPECDLLQFPFGVKRSFIGGGGVFRDLGLDRDGDISV